MDEIFIEGIRLRPRIGITARERARRPLCSVDLVIQYDLTRAARSDDLSETLDYEAIRNDVLRRAGEREYHLLETLADRIAISIARHSGVKQTTVTVRKLGARGLAAYGVRRRCSKKSAAALEKT